MSRSLPLALCAILSACTSQPLSNTHQTTHSAENAQGRPEHPSAWLYRELAREQALIHWELEERRRQRAARLIDNYKWSPNDD